MVFVRVVLLFSVATIITFLFMLNCFYFSHHLPFVSFFAFVVFGLTLHNRAVNLMPCSVGLHWYVGVAAIGFFPFFLGLFAERKWLEKVRWTIKCFASSAFAVSFLAIAQQAADRGVAEMWPKTKSQVKKANKKTSTTKTSNFEQKASDQLHFN